MNMLEILNQDLRIEKNIFGNVSFRDKHFENFYLEKTKKESEKKSNDFFKFYILIIGSILTLINEVYYYPVNLKSKWIFIFVLFEISTYINNINFFMNFYKFLESFNLEERRQNVYQILKFIILYNVKFIYLYINIKQNENVYYQEIIRTINSLYFIGYSIKLDQNISHRLCFFIANLLCNKVMNFENNINTFISNTFFSITMTILLYFFRKSREHNLRLFFSREYCLEKSFFYTNDFINELKGVHITRKDEKIYASGKEAMTFLQNFQPEVYNTEHNLNDRERFSFILDSTNKFDSFIKSMKKFNIETYKNNLNPDCLILPNLEKDDHNIDKNNLIPLGIFYNSKIENKFYEVQYRKFYVTQEIIIENLFLYDISNHILAEIKLKEESIIKQRLYGKLSHEFKTPLTSIIGLIDDIKDTLGCIENEEISIKLETITSLSKYVVLLTQDIIQFSSQFNSDSLFINKSEIDIIEIIKFGNDILNCLLRCTDRKSTTIKTIVNYDEKINNLIIKNDETRIKQILLNFLSNAVKFTKSGSITISAETDTNMDNIILSVIDTGIGLSVENSKKLFEEFSMIKNKSINNSLGSGLGLSICKALASKLGLEINLTSKYLMGSAFSISIPCELRLNDIKESNNFFNKKRMYKSSLNLNRFNPFNTNNSSLTVNSFTPFKKSENSNLINLETKKNYIDICEKIDEEKTNVINMNLVNENTDLLDNLIDEPLAKKQLDTEEFINLNIDTGTFQYINFLVRVSLDFSLNYNLEEVRNKKYKIIIIDDNKIVLQSLKKIIESTLIDFDKYYEVICGSDGIDLLNFIRDDKEKGNLVKFIIIDENMEYLDGSETIRIVRKLENKGNVKSLTIFSSTCHEDKDLMKSILVAGCNFILPKPLTRIDLINAFKKFKLF